MFRLVTVFALVSCTFADIFPNGCHGRIVNGIRTTIEKHPYQVSMQTNVGIEHCGGSIINKDTIVTSGNCLYLRRPAGYKIRLGSTEYNSGGELVEIKAFRIHEKYNRTTRVNDIGIIKLAKPVPESHNIRYIELATKTPESDTRAVVTGWGSECYMGCNENPPILQEAELKIVNKRNCVLLNGRAVQPSMLCAYAFNKDFCIGDEGGPLVAESKLVGVVSWGYGCALEGHPGMYADVAYLREWILDTAKSL